MLDLLRIDHISQAVADLEPQVELLEGLFGFRSKPAHFNEDRDMYAMKLSIPGNSDVYWELIAPGTSDSYVQRFLDGRHGPGLHHVSLWVRDVNEARAQLEWLGIEPWSDRPPGEPGGEWFETHIHPARGGNGFLFQIRAEHTQVGHEQPPPPRYREHTLGIVAVNHLSHAHPNRVELAEWYATVFGMRSIYRSPVGDDRAFVTEVLQVPSGQMRWEILEPQGEHSFVQRFLETRGPAMHHVTFQVADWDAALAACEYHGVPVFGGRDGETDGAAWSEAFINPRYTGGVLVQLFWEGREGIWI